MSLKYVAASRLPTRWGEFTLHGFEELQSGKEHVALTMGELDPESPVLMRIHSECLTGDALYSLRCDCGPQLQAAMQRIAEEGSGVILYLRQEGRGIGLLNKIRAYALQDQGHDTVEANEKLGFAADQRDYSFIGEMLEKVSVKKARLMTNNPRKVKAMQACGVEVVERVPHCAGQNPHNSEYLSTKAGKLGHLL